ncbi:hypothetical protein GGR53DRAFT_132116 [Hypoxylon sp. FL1150]|nr:hypothetical protein GGR53DRAFT_132116 [Hypoxylon sp. FL1150]
MKSPKHRTQIVAKVAKGPQAGPIAANEEHQTSRVIQAAPIGNKRMWLVEIEHGDKTQNDQMNDMELLSRLLADGIGTKRCIWCLDSKPVAKFWHIGSSRKKTLLCAECRGGNAKYINEELEKLQQPYRLCRQGAGSHLKPLGDFLQGDTMLKTCAHCRARARSRAGKRVAARKTKVQSHANRLSLYEASLAEAYLNGRPIQALSDNLGIPVSDLLGELRFYLVLFCQDNEHGLKSVLRKGKDYERFRQGLSPTLMKEDSLYVYRILKKTPWLNQKLEDPGFRRRIVGAFSNVEFHEVADQDNSTEDPSDSEGSLHKKETI